MHEWLQRALVRPVFTGSGQLRALEASELEGERGASIMTAINRIAQRKLTLEEVHIRGMNAANNVVDYYDSAFTVRSLKQAAKLYPDTAMAEGHDMSRKALARVFAGDVLENAAGSKVRGLRDLGQASWLRGLWYVSRSLSWASDLVEAVDAGIQREVSLHWYFTDARCGICSEDIRSCDHFPGETYDGVRCWYDMENVTDIIETSFVIKGGQRGTSLWQPAQLEGSMSFGRAIRELKSDSAVFSEYRSKFRKAFGPSPNDGKQRRESRGAVDWIGQARKRPA